MARSPRSTSSLSPDASDAGLHGLAVGRLIRTRCPPGHAAGELTRGACGLPTAEESRPHREERAMAKKGKKNQGRAPPREPIGAAIIAELTDQDIKHATKWLRVV